MASIIVGYGVLLAALGSVVRSITPEKGTIAFIVGVTGGGLCLLCGIVACAGHNRRMRTILTLIGIVLVLLIQTVEAWVPSTDKSGTVAGALLLTLMLLLTVGILMYVVHGERPPEFYLPETARRDNSPSRGNDAQSNGGGRQSK